MSSVARYIASLKSKTIAKSTKVQYQNHVVTTNTLTDGIIPCGRISFNQIRYNDKICCGRPAPPVIYDGGSPDRTSIFILDGGTPTMSGPRILDSGNI